MRTVDQGSTDDEVETLTILNAILRHHVRNHVTVIRGRAQWLGRGNAGAADVETITRHCDEMAATVDRIEAITNSLEQTGRERVLDLGAFVTDEATLLADVYDANLTVSTSAAETTGVADELFSFVLREMCTNVLAAAMATQPSIEIGVEPRDDGVEVSVTCQSSDSIPEALSTDPFATAANLDGSSEYGLFLSQAILARYGGTIDIEENEAGMLCLRATVPRAD